MKVYVLLVILGILMMVGTGAAATASPAQQEEPKTYLYYQVSTGQWLHRIDTNSPVPVETAGALVAGHFGIASEDVATIETVALTQEELDSLRLATEWTGTPPGLPQPSDIVTGLLIFPPPLPESDYPPFPTSTHWATVEALNQAASKPLTVERLWGGYHYTFNCYVSTELTDLYAKGRLAIGDYVLVDFVENDVDKCLGTLKIHKSW